MPATRAHSTSLLLLRYAKMMDEELSTVIGEDGIIIYFNPATCAAFANTHTLSRYDQLQLIGSLLSPWDSHSFFSKELKLSKEKLVQKVVFKRVDCNIILGMIDPQSQVVKSCLQKSKSRFCRCATFLAILKLIPEAVEDPILKGLTKKKPEATGTS